MLVKIFCCYAHEDELLLNKLKAHLRPLQRQELIDVWHDRNIRAGMEWEHEINEQLNTANIILLLVSPAFMNSDYCYGIEMKRALERHERGEVIVIPIILRPVYWQGILGKLQALPTDARPVMDHSWHTFDEGFLNIVEGIRNTVGELIKENTIGTPILKQTSVQSSTSLQQNLSPIKQIQGKSQLYNHSRRLLGRRLLSLLGTIIGFALTTFGFVSFISFCYSNPNTSALTISGAFMLLGTFIFCKNTAAIIGKYIGYFFFVLGILLALIGIITSNIPLFYMMIGTILSFISVLFILGTRTRRW